MCMLDASYKVCLDYFCFGFAEKLVIQIAEAFLLWRRNFGTYQSFL